MGISPSKRVSESLSSSDKFNSSCESVYEDCLSLSQHAFPGIPPYQLSTASSRLHQSLASSNFPLVVNWLASPPSQYQVDTAYRRITTQYHHHEDEEDKQSSSSCLGPTEFKAFSVELFAGAVLDNAGKAVMTRVPFGIAGIVGIGAITHSGKDLVGTAVGVYALGVAASIYLGLTA